MSDFKNWFTRSGVEYVYLPGIRALSTSNAPVWHPTVFTKDRERLFDGVVAEEVL